MQAELNIHLSFVLWPNWMTSPGLTDALLPLPMTAPLTAVPNLLKSAGEGPGTLAIAH